MEWFFTNKVLADGMDRCCCERVRVEAGWRDPLWEMTGWDGMVR